MDATLTPNKSVSEACVYWLAEIMRLREDAKHLDAEGERINRAFEVRKTPGLPPTELLTEQCNTHRELFTKWKADFEAALRNLEASTEARRQERHMANQTDALSSTPAGSAGADSPTHHALTFATEGVSDVEKGLQEFRKAFGELQLHLWDRITGTNVGTSKDSSIASTR
jgi:hypothetical protein